MWDVYNSLAGSDCIYQIPPALLRLCGRTSSCYMDHILGEPPLLMPMLTFTPCTTPSMRWASTRLPIPQPGPVSRPRHYSRDQYDSPLPSLGCLLTACAKFHYLGVLPDGREANDGGGKAEDDGPDDVVTHVGGFRRWWCPRFVEVYCLVTGVDLEVEI